MYKSCSSVFKTFLLWAYAAGFSSRYKLLWDPALICLSYPNIHIVLTEEWMNPVGLFLLLLGDQDASYTAPQIKIL